MMRRKLVRSKRLPGRRSGMVAAMGATTVMLVVALLSGCAGDPTGGTQILKIGVVAPFSGDYESLGRSVRDSVLLAAEAWNQQGGVLGFEVQVVLEDTKCDYHGGRSAAEASIAAGAPFLIGAVCANASEGVAQVATDSGALQITPGSVNLDLTLDVEGQVRDLVYRIPSVDDDQGAVAAHFSLERLGHKTAAVLYAEDSDYGSMLAQAFVRAFEAGGGDVIKVHTYDQDAELFFEVLDAVRAESPDMLYLPGYYDVINRLVAQARQFGLLMPIVGSDGWHAAGLDLAVTDGAYFTTHYTTEEPRGLLQSWIQLYQARYLVPPDALAAMSYDAANVLFSAIEAAGTTDPVFVAQALGDIEYEGVSGAFVFDENHNPVRQLIVMRADPAGLVFQGRFDP